MSSWLMLFAAWLLTAATPVWAQRDLREIPEPDPELERATFQLPPGFEVNLYAADPLLAKPIQMNFDGRGRLWVATSSVYPQIEPGQVADDKVLIIEDQDHDGTAETTTVFAGGLLIPTAVLPSGRGAFVANSTELLYFDDGDGDGRADDRQVVLSGFGTEDTHHILHTFRWGPDLRMYMNQSIYIHSHLETPWGVRRMNGSGTWAFQPKSLRLETFCLGLVNPWGIAWDDYGQTFATDGAGGEGINFVFPGFVGMTSPGARRILAGLNPGKPKLCGLEIVVGEHLPPEFRGNLIANDFRAHRVCRYEVRDDGSGFAATELSELIKSDHPAFRPVDVKQGPDGAIYIADWYNPIIQHGEVDFRDPRRDKVHGRIWRVTYRDGATLQHLSIPDLSTDQLLDLLRSPERWRRDQAKVELVERGVAVAQPLRRWWRSLSESDERSRWCLEALWVLMALDEVDAELLDRLQSDADFRVRAAVARVLETRFDLVPDARERLARLVVDSHPRVRLEAVRGLSRARDPAACQVALRVLDQPMDRFLEFALWTTVNDLQSVWVPALRDGRLQLSQRPDHWVYALQAVERADVVPMLEAMLSRDDVSAEEAEALIATLARLAGRDQLGAVWKFLFDSSASPGSKQEVMTSLLARADVGQVDWARWIELIGAGDESLRVAALHGVGRWRGEPALADVRRIAQNDRESMTVRQAAIAALGQVGGASDREWLARTANDAASAGLRPAAIVALADQDLDIAVRACVAWMAEPGSNEDPQPVVLQLLERRQGAERLATALAGQRIRPDAARLALRGLESTGRREPDLAAALVTSGELSLPRANWTDEQRREFLASVIEQGKAAAGEEVFRRGTLGCLKCHAIGSAGGEVGPELGSIGGSAQLDYLLESLLEPNKKIKENYHSVVVVTDEGRILSGVKLRETESALLVRDAENKIQSIPLDAIDEQQDGGSLMPAGLMDSLTDAELRDLVRFLGELGKAGPFALPTQRYLRQWETIVTGTPATDGAARLGIDRLIAQADSLTWSPIVARVDGRVPLSEVASVQDGATGASSSLLRAAVEVGESSRVRLEVEGDGAGLQLWIDNRPVTVAQLRDTWLEPGQHRLLMVIGGQQRSPDPRVMVREEAAGG